MRLIKNFKKILSFPNNLNTIKPSIRVKSINFEFQNATFNVKKKREMNNFYKFNKLRINIWNILYSRLFYINPITGQRQLIANYVSINIIIGICVGFCSSLFDSERVRRRTTRFYPQLICLIRLSLSFYTRSNNSGFFIKKIILFFISFILFISSLLIYIWQSLWNRCGIWYSGGLRMDSYEMISSNYSNSF